MAGSTSGQELICICSNNHLLRATIFMQINQECLPRYMFIQQPSFSISPYKLLVDNIFAEINQGPNMLLLTYEGEGDNDNIVPKDPALEVAQNDNIVPKDPALEVAQNFESRENHGDRGYVVPREHQLSLSDRKEGWIIRSLPRTNGKRSDPSYIHIKTDKMFRSWTEVLDFIVHRRLPERQRGIKAHSPRRARADKLLNLFAVGFYNPETKQLLCTGNRIHISSKKRKRGEDNSVGEVPHGYTHILYDFEPIDPTQ